MRIKVQLVEVFGPSSGRREMSRRRPIIDRSGGKSAFVWGPESFGTFIGLGGGNAAVGEQSSHAKCCYGRDCRGGMNSPWR